MCASVACSEAVEKSIAAVRTVAVSLPGPQSAAVVRNRSQSIPPMQDGEAAVKLCPAFFCPGSNVGSGAQSALLGASE